MHADNIERIITTKEIFELRRTLLHYQHCLCIEQALSEHFGSDLILAPRRTSNKYAVDALNTKHAIQAPFAPSDTCFVTRRYIALDATDRMSPFDLPPIYTSV